MNKNGEVMAGGKKTKGREISQTPALAENSKKKKDEPELEREKEKKEKRGQEASGEARKEKKDDVAAYDSQRRSKRKFRKKIS